MRFLKRDISLNSIHSEYYLVIIIIEKKVLFNIIQVITLFTEIVQFMTKDKFKVNMGFILS